MVPSVQLVKADGNYQAIDAQVIFYQIDTLNNISSTISEGSILAGKYL
jgi:hypothetical protein